MNPNERFISLSEDELSNIEGGLIITGTAVATGVAIFGGSFAVGYAIGQSRRR